MALHSAAPRLGDVPANVGQVARACADGDELVVFPEMFLTGYNVGDDVQRLALHAGDDRLGPLRDAARDGGAHLIVGAPLTTRRGTTYNAALCIDDAGRESWVPKRALPNFTTFQEHLFFTHGDAQPVWETRLGNIGVGICYDLYFPEFQKQQVMEGADILVNISAGPSTSRRFFELLLAARAVENAVFSLYSNNVGAQDGIVFWGGSRALGPRGDVMAKTPPYEEGVARATLDLDDLRAAREFRPTIRDSRHWVEAGPA